MDSNDQAKGWAKEKALTEEEAFNYVIRSGQIKQSEFEIDDQYEQAYRKGRADQREYDERLIAENEELRHQVRVLNDMNMRLREAILHHTDYDYD